MRCTKCGDAPSSLNALQLHYSLLELRERIRARIHRIFVLCQEPAEPEVADSSIHSQSIAANAAAIDELTSSAP